VIVATINIVTTGTVMIMETITDGIVAEVIKTKTMAIMDAAMAGARVAVMAIMINKNKNFDVKSPSILKGFFCWLGLPIKMYF
jgi:hypothetical protein